MPSHDTLVEKGILVVPTEITGENVSDFVEDALAIAINEEIKVVNVIVNCYGGNTDMSIQMIDTLNYIKSMGKKVITICTGIAASAGFDIFVIGDERKVTKYSSLMAHRYSWGSYLKHPDLVAKRKAEDWAFETQIQIFKDSLGWSRKRILKLLLSKDDKWYTPNEALDLGIATELI